MVLALALILILVESSIFRKIFYCDRVDTPHRFVPARKMHLLVNLLIFCVMLFLYLHIYFHLKTSNDLEVYDIDPQSKETFEEICDLRQPVVFAFPAAAVEASSGTSFLADCRQANLLATYGAFDVKVRHVTQPPGEDEELYTVLPLKDALQALDHDTAGRYLVESNGDFLEETGLRKRYSAADAFLRPPLVTSCRYDYMTASAGVHTPLRYDLNYRHFVCVAEGAIKIKLAPPSATRYLHPVTDYENLEFRSPMNPWRPDCGAAAASSMAASFEKVKCLEVGLAAGQVLYIPAYWWYSVAFPLKAPSSPVTTLCTFSYRTIMNTIAIAPQLAMHLLQTQNVQRKSVKRHVPITEQPASTANDLTPPSSTISSTSLIPTTQQPLPVELQNSLEHGVIAVSELPPPPTSATTID